MHGGRGCGHQFRHRRTRSNRFRWAGGRFNGNRGTEPRNFGLERRALGRLKGYGDKSREDFQGSVKRGRGSLGAQERRERVRGLVAGAGGDYVVDGMVHLFRGALEALEVVTQGARNRLFNRCRFLGHKSFRANLWGSARFLILEGGRAGVNGSEVPMCPIVASREVPDGAQLPGGLFSRNWGKKAARARA